MELKKMEKDFDEIIKDSRNIIAMPVNEVGITTPGDMQKKIKQLLVVSEVELSSKSYRDFETAEVCPGKSFFVKILNTGNIPALSKHYLLGKTVFAEIYLRFRNGQGLSWQKFFLLKSWIRITFR